MGGGGSNPVKSVTKAVTSAVSSVTGGVTSAVSNVVSNPVSAVTNPIQKIISPVASGAYDAAGDLAEGAYKTAITPVVKPVVAAIMPKVAASSNAGGGGIDVSADSTVGVENVAGRKRKKRDTTDQLRSGLAATLKTNNASSGLLGSGTPVSIPSAGTKKTLGS